MTALTLDQVADFHRDGFVVVPGFYDLATEIEPIQRAIHRIIKLVIRRHSVPIDQPAFSAASYDASLLPLIAVDRAFGGEVYDALKLIPAFVRLAACERNERAYAQLRGTEAVGFARGGLGIRVDLPAEERYRAGWHQEYLFQLRSIDGVTVWSPLGPVDAGLGPMRLCPGSHKDGVRPMGEINPDKFGPYAWGVDGAEEIATGYSWVAPETGPGDAIFVDYLTLHRSGVNAGRRARVSMQMRFFNWEEPGGLALGWPPGITEGSDFTVIHPEHFAGGGE